MDKKIEKSIQAIDTADNIIIGGGAGLSDAAGLKYYGSRFTDNFGPFIEKYGVTDMYSAGFYPFLTQEERWAYWAKHISLNRYETPPTALYKELFKLVSDKKYFVITTNVDAQFEKSGVQKDRIFAVQGDYGYFQCAKGCHDTLYYNEREVSEMVRLTENLRIPPALVPICPVCGGDMEVHIRKDRYFVQNKEWHVAQNHYVKFTDTLKGKTVYLELGVGFNTPGIIRLPFEQMVYRNPNATLIRVNKDHSEGPQENQAKTIAFAEDISLVINNLRGTQEAA